MKNPEEAANSLLRESNKAPSLLTTISCKIHSLQQMEGCSKRQQLSAEEVIKLSRAGNYIGISANEVYIWKVIRLSQSLQFLLPQIKEQCFKSSKPQSSCFNLSLFLYFLFYDKHITHARHKKCPPATEKLIRCISK